MVSRAACRVFGATVLVVVAAPRALALQETFRVSVDSSGAEADGGSRVASVSADGRYVVFTSDADDLVPADTNQHSDVFVRDRRAGTTELVSVDSSGYGGDFDSYTAVRGAISDDGARVVFSSHATNLDPNDTNYYVDVYVHDRRDGTTTLVSVDPSGIAGNGSSSFASISRDGRLVVFSSAATNLVANDRNDWDDVFVRDLAAGTTERVSVDSSGNEGDSLSLSSAISSDGSFVAFGSWSSNLVASDTNNTADVFVRDRRAGTTERVSVDSNGAEANGYCDWPSISADGSFVAFESASKNLVPGDTNYHIDVFLRDRALGTTSLVSVDSSGALGNGSSFSTAIDPSGSFVAFASDATNLVAGDANHVDDVFVHDVATGETVRSSVDSSGGDADQRSGNPSISAGGRVVAFESVADDLVASDTNGVPDVFVLDPCGTFADWTNYGAGFPGTHGVPALTATQFPQLGATISVVLANSYGQPTLGFLVLGFQRASLPTKWGGDLLVLPTTIVPISFSYGADSFTGTIPDANDLCGVTLDLQGIEVDPGAVKGMSFSQGLELVIGD